MQAHFSKVFVINMAKDTHRMRQVAQELQKSHTIFERIEGLTPNTIDRYELQKSVSPFCRMFCTNATVGCALTHHVLWQKIVADDLSSALILEDDVYFVEGWQQILHDAVAQLPRNWDMLYLGCGGLCDKEQIKNPLMKVFVPFRSPNGSTKVSDNLFVPGFPLLTHAYAVSAQGCRKLLQAIDKIKFHIDFLIASNQNALNIYACHPNIAYQRSDDSNIVDMSFPRTLNTLLSKYRDDKNFKYSYYFNAPLIQYVNMWTFLFFVFGVMVQFCKPISIPFIALFVVEADLRNMQYLTHLFVFLVGYNIAAARSRIAA
jgi:GR25 family glycosyltransferase involved in LPS biosynthesis